LTFGKTMYNKALHFMLRARAIMNTLWGKINLHNLVLNTFFLEAC